MDDNGIIGLFWQRDEAAIAQTAEKYGRRCSRIAMNILDNAQDAEECVSDTYLRAWNSIPPQKPSCFAAWLGRITRNLALNRLSAAKAAKRGDGQVVLALHELEECVSGAASCQSEDGEIIEAVNEFLRGVRQRDRSIFILRYWQLEPVADIAARHDLSQSNVTTILCRLRKQLRVHLERKGIDI